MNEKNFGSPEKKAEEGDHALIEKAKELAKANIQNIIQGTKPPEGFVKLMEAERDITDGIIKEIEGMSPEDQVELMENFFEESE